MVAEINRERHDVDSRLNQRSQFCAAGKLVARAYREEFGEEPPRRQQSHATDRGLMDMPTTSSRQRIWVTTAEAGAALGMSRETLRQLQWHLDNVEATITGWSRRKLR